VLSLELQLKPLYLLSDLTRGKTSRILSRTNHIRTVGNNYEKSTYGNILLKKGVTPFE